VTSGELKPAACNLSATILAIDLGKYKSVAWLFPLCAEPQSE
jgi:hypothetical protein